MTDLAAPAEATLAGASDITVVADTPIPKQTLQNRLYGRIDCAIVAYLSLPLAVFFARAFKPTVAVVLLVLLGVGLVPLAKSVARVKAIGTLTWPTVFTVVGFSAVWTALGASGHMFYANTDWQKHDAVFSDLARYPWPTTFFHEAGGNVILRYYEGYYAVPAAFTRYLGHHNLWLQLWTTIGVSLVALRLVAPIQRIGVRLLALVSFALFDGLDVIGWIVKMGGTAALTRHQQIDGWFGSQVLQFSNTTTLLFWVPQHAIAAWLAVMLIRERKDDDFVRGIPVLMLAVVFWSVFSFVGLLPFVALVILRRIGRDQLRFVLSPPVLASVALLLLVGVFMTSGSQGMKAGWQWDLFGYRRALTGILLFLGLELFAVVAAMKVAGVRFGGRERLAIVVLVALSTYVYGTFGDLAMRAGIPAQFIVFLAMRDWLARKDRKALGSLRVVPLAMVLLIGAYTAVPEFVDAVGFGGRQVALGAVPDTIQLVGTVSGDIPASQYLATEPGWLSSLMRTQQPIYNVQSVASADTTDFGWHPTGSVVPDILTNPAPTIRQGGQYVVEVSGNARSAAQSTYSLNAGKYRVTGKFDVSRLPKNGNVVLDVGNIKSVALHPNASGVATIDMYVFVWQDASKLTIIGQGLDATPTNVRIEQLQIDQTVPR